MSGKQPLPNQHQPLHDVFGAHDCCLCRVEHERDALAAEIRTLREERDALKAQLDTVCSADPCPECGAGVSAKCWGCVAKKTREECITLRGKNAGLRKKNGLLAATVNVLYEENARLRQALADPARRCPVCTLPVEGKEAPGV